MASGYDIAAAVRKAAEIAEQYELRRRIDAGYLRVDVLGLCDTLQLPVIFRPLNGLLGAFLREPSPGILLNIDRPQSLIRLTCAHELGHYSLGHNTTIDIGDLESEINQNSPAELQANQFSYELMMPKWLIAKICRLKHWDRKQLSSPNVIYQLSLRLGVSYTATVWTLQRLKLIDYQIARNASSIQPKTLKQRAIGPKDIADWRQDVWVLDQFDKDVVLEPRGGDNFVVLLKDHASAGYVWNLEQAASEGFVFEPLSADSDSSPSVRETEDLLIGGSKDISAYVLKAREPDSVQTERQQLTFREHKPWDDDVSPDDPQYGIGVSFISYLPGLSNSDKRALLEASA